MVHNITSVYRDADKLQHAEGLLWYSDALKSANLMAIKHGVPVYIAVAVIAALSPNNKWSRNLTNADALIGAFVNGDGIDSVKVSTYHKMKAKAWGILAARPDYDGAKRMLKGQKITRSFGHHGRIQRDHDGPPETPMVSASDVDDRSDIGVREYRAASRVRRDGAARRLMPYQLRR